MSKRSHREMSLVDKIAMIRASEATPKPTHIFLSAKFGIGRSTVGEILKKKKLYEEQWKRNIHSKRCRILKSSNADVINERLYMYFNQAKLKKVPINGPILQSMALEMARELGVENFKASNGWLDSWKKRFNIKKFKNLQENSQPIESEVCAVDDYKFRLPSMTAGFSSEDIFNCDETSLFFRALPAKSLEENVQLVKNGEFSKERLTILLCCSSTGEKLKPLVIGRTNFSKVCKGLELSSLPVQWRSNRKAWMETACFSEWLQGVNRQMEAQGRKIILFMDSASSHIAANVSLSNVTILLIPAFSCLQPIEAGIKDVFKANYRKRLIQHVITQQHLATKLSNKITVLHAISWIACAWKEVSSLVISGIFRQCGFDVKTSPLTDQVPDDSLQQLLDTASVSGIQVHLSAKDYISADDDLQTESSEILSDSNNSVFKDENQVESEDDDIEICIPSHPEALYHLDRLAIYFSSKDEECANLIDLITQMVSKNILFEKQSLIQSMVHSLYTT